MYVLTPKLINSSIILGGLDSAEPWQGRWAGGILVECVGRQDENTRGGGEVDSNRNNRPQTAIANAGQI